MEYVLNIGAIPNELVCDLENLGVWLSCLQILQVRIPSFENCCAKSSVTDEIISRCL